MQSQQPLLPECYMRDLISRLIEAVKTLQDSKFRKYQNAVYLHTENLIIPYKFHQ